MTEQQEQYDIVEAEVVNLGTVQAKGPAGVIEEASTIATQLAEIVNSRKLYSTISGRKYVKVEGWTTLGAMLGVLPREVDTHRIEDGWESTVELIRANDGQVIGRGSAICTRDERNWSERDDYAVRSMAITRATGKAYRLGFSWVMALAGYEPTPAEEMDTPSQRQPSRRTPQNRPRAASGGNGSRPFEPPKLREVIAKGIEDKRERGFAFDDGKLSNYRGAMNANLEMCFAGDKHSDQKRHFVLEYLVGKASSTEMDDAEVKTVHKWLGATKNEDTGEWTPDPTAVIEAKAVARQAELDAGQQEMRLE